MRIPFSFIKTVGGGGAAPTVTSIDLDLGDTAGGEVRTLTGTNFTGATAVSVGGTAATVFSVISDTELHVTMPAHAAAAGCSILVTTPVGTNAPNALYEYFTPNSATPTIFVEPPNYAEAAGAGTFTATVGSNLTAAASAPSAVNGAPLFTAGKVGIANAMDLGTCAGAVDCFAACVADIVANTGTNSSVYYADHVFRFGGNFGFAYYRSGAGPYQYWALFYEASGTAGDATVLLGYQQALVEITSLVDASGAGRVVLQGKKEGGLVHIKANGGAWVAGDACYDAWTPGLAGTLVVGAQYSANLPIEARVLSVAVYNATQSNAFANKVAVWGASRT